MIRSTEPRTAAYHRGWEIMEHAGEYWIPSRGRIGETGLEYTFPNTFPGIVAAIHAIDAHGKTCAETQGDADGKTPTAPEGYALVPIMPTVQMMVAGSDHVGEDGCSLKTWRAMLAAAKTN